MQMMMKNEQQATEAFSAHALGVVDPGCTPHGSVHAGKRASPRTGPGFVPEAKCPQRALQQVRGASGVAHVLGSHS